MLLGLFVLVSEVYNLVNTDLVQIVETDLNSLCLWRVSHYEPGLAADFIAHAMREPSQVVVFIRAVLTAKVIEIVYLANDRLSPLISAELFLVFMGESDHGFAGC